MATLDDLLDSDPVDRARHRADDAGQQLATAARVGLYWTGWAAAKLALLVLTVLAAALVGAGWFAARAVWPALVWAGKAVRLGWEEGRKPGGAHGPA